MRYTRKKAAASAVAEPRLMSTYARMGQLVGQKIESESDVLALVRKGLPARSVLGFPDKRVLDLKLIAPESTLRRRVENNQSLTIDESERMMRLARITSLSEGLFGDEAMAKAWLSKPGRFVAGSDPISPLELATTESGARIIESVLLRVEHGMP
jgi:putative toxin-antitoxin system antitoxin component (TIGR02293 family)